METDRFVPAAGAQCLTVRWTPFELARREAVEAGFSTVSRLHNGTDEALVQWAQVTGRFVYIGERQPQGRGVLHERSIWFNPYGRTFGDNATRVRLYADYLDGRPKASPRLPKMPGPELLKRLSELEGMVLCCWCVPEYACHGEELLRRLGGEHWRRYQAAVEAHRKASTAG